MLLDSSVRWAWRTGGKIARVVNGYPDEINDIITEYAYGTKRVLKPVAELTQIRLGIDADIKPKWAKTILCKVLEKILYETLNISKRMV